MSTDDKRKTASDIKGFKFTLAAAIVLAIAAYFLCFFGFFYDLDRIATDRIQYEEVVPDHRIKIIAIDERTINAYGDVRTWNRDIYSDLIDRIYTDETSPELLGIDIMFIGDVEKVSDNAFAMAAYRAGNIVTAANLVYGKKELSFNQPANVISVGDENIEMLELPYKALRDHVDYGFANALIDDDGYIRYAKKGIEIVSKDTDNSSETAKATYLPSFAYMLYKKHCELSGEALHEPETDSEGNFGFTYTGSQGSYEVLSMCDVLDGAIDPRAFNNCILLLGAYAPGMQDAYNVPISRGEQMYGVEINANILQSLIDETSFVRPDKTVYALVTALIVFGFSMLILWLRPVKSAALLVSVIVAAVFVCRLSFAHGLSFGITIPGVLLVLAFIMGLLGHYVFQRIRNRQVLKALNQYVAPAVVKKLQSKGGFEVKLGGDNREIAVLFIDIRGFTTMSEGLSPEEVVGILNEYLALVTKAIFDNGGTLDKYIGDAVMAIFNAPFDLDDYEYRAVSTARDILNGEKELSYKLMAKFGKTVSFGIGINLGEAVVGNIGCDFRKDYTAIGDTVNTAARLESNAARGQVLISSTLRERLGNRIKASEIGAIPLKGKSKEVIVYQLDEVL